MNAEEQAIILAAKTCAGFREHQDPYDEDERYYASSNCKKYDDLLEGAFSEETKAFYTKGMYSEEDVKNMIKEFGHHINRKYNPQHPLVGEVTEWFEQNKKK